MASYGLLFHHFIQSKKNQEEHEINLIGGKMCNLDSSALLLHSLTLKIIKKSHKNKTTQQTNLFTNYSTTQYKQKTPA